MGIVNSEGERVAAKTQRQKGAQRKEMRVNSEWSIVNNFFGSFAFFAPLREMCFYLSYPGVVVTFCEDRLVPSRRYRRSFRQVKAFHKLEGPEKPKCSPL